MVEQLDRQLHLVIYHLLRIRKWAYDNNFLSVLVEGFNGFPNDVDCVGKIFKANEEILVNYLITTLTHLSK